MVNVFSCHISWNPFISCDSIKGMASGSFLFFFFFFLSVIVVVFVWGGLVCLFWWVWGFDFSCFGWVLTCS